ncbi:MAG: hypothetical protein GY725_20030 [bacterium]|nr:hypothetical protein [bacterium]
MGWPGDLKTAIFAALCLFACPALAGSGTDPNAPPTIQEPSEEDLRLLEDLDLLLELDLLEDWDPRENLPIPVIRDEP